MERINLHCNANAFYDSVKCLYIPSVRNCPVAVCGNMEDRFCVNEEPDCGNHCYYMNAPCSWQPVTGEGHLIAQVV